MSVKNPAVGIASTVMGLGALWYLLAEAISAIGFPNYSYARNFISDLGVPGEVVFEGHTLNSRLSELMNAGFVGYGLSTVIAGVALWWVLPRGGGKSVFLALTIVQGFGIAFVGLVHGSPENTESGLVAFHSIGALMGIVGGNALAIWAGTRTLRPLLGPRLSHVTIGLGALGLVSVIILAISLGAGTHFPGISERGAVYTIVAWQLLFAIHILRETFDHKTVHALKDS